MTGALITVAGLMPIGFAKSVTGEHAGGIFWIVGSAVIFSPLPLRERGRGEGASNMAAPEAPTPRADARFTLTPALSRQGRGRVWTRCALYSA
jgi:hypothetical protein